MQYYHGHSVSAGDPSDGSTSFYVNMQGSDRIPSQSYHDAQMSYRFDAEQSPVLKGLELAFSIQISSTRSPPSWRRS